MKTYRSSKEIAATVRAELKKQLPAWKFSVRVKSYSGGSSIHVSLMAGPEQVVEYVREVKWAGEVVRHDFQGYAQLNHYQLERPTSDVPRLSNGAVFTPVGWDVMVKANEVLSAEHWDESDVQSDYFSTNFYRHLEVGRWDKPYTVKGVK